METTSTKGLPTFWTYGEKRMKGGANLHEQNAIRKMTEDGMTVPQISEALKIYPENVQNWVDHFFPKDADDITEEIQADPEEEETEDDEE